MVVLFPWTSSFWQIIQKSCMSRLDQMSIRVFSDPQDVTRLIGTVQKQADAHKQALGFLPKSVYLEAVLQSKLLVAVDDKSGKYVGHLLFGGIAPRGRVFQVLVSPRYRRKSVGQTLLRHLVTKMEGCYYLSITAQVAADLVEANAFWDRMGFGLVQTKPGGQTRRRTLNIRVRDLNTPNLFNFKDLVATGSTADLHLVDRLFAQTPVYVIDLNVLFDVTKKRLRAKEAGAVMNAGFRNVVRVAVSEEFVEELKRTSLPRPDDPLLSLALELPRLTPPSEPSRTKMVETLANLVFYDRFARGALTTQDQSDLVHLATAIHHKSAGFVTGEKSILRAREQLQQTHGIDIVGVAEFAETMEPSRVDRGPLQARIQGVHVSVAAIDEQNRIPAQNFLRRMYVPDQQVVEATVATQADVLIRRVILSAGEDIIAFGSWSLRRGPMPMSEAFLCVDQDHQAAESAAEFLIAKICRECSRVGPALIKLRQMPGHALTLHTAMASGFRATEGFTESQSVLQKIALGRPVYESNWAWARKELLSLSGVDLPESMPRDALGDRIVITSPSGKRVRTTLYDLETLLSPALFVSRVRSCCIVPVKRKFAELLLESRQFQMLEAPEVTFLNERTYFSSPRTASIISNGGCLLFYESAEAGGHSAVVAAARIVRVTVEPRRSVSLASHRRGVLNPIHLEQMGRDEKITVTAFDNLMMLRNPVGLVRLRQLGCADGSNFVTAKRVDPKQVATILEEGEAGV